MTKKTTILTENMVRRWGKLANMKTLTENFIDQLAEEDEEMEVELSADGAEVEAGDEMEMDMDLDAEAEGAAQVSLSEPEVAMIVQGIADKLGELTGAEIEVETSEEAGLEGEAEDDMMDAAEDMMGAEDDLEDADPAMRDAYNRKDITEKDDTKKADKDADETLDVDVVDEEKITEAVLARVIERLMKKSK
tara:strand:- start:1191 stop:1766 length:576 start_codon:yes stop_codon:yes gene_type:complete